MCKSYLLVLIGLLATLLAYSKSYTVIGSNGRSAEFSGFLYSDSSGIFSRLKNGTTMNIPWSKIDKSMYGDPDDLLFQPHYLKDKDTPTALSWGFYSSPIWDDKTLKFKNSIFITSNGNHALIMADEFNKYEILCILTSNSWDVWGTNSGPVDPFSAPRAGQSRITGNSTNLMITKKLEELGISLDYESLALLKYKKMQISDSFFAHLLFRKKHANFQIITHGGDTLFESNITYGQNFDPFASQPQSSSFPEVSIAEFSQIKSAKFRVFINQKEASARSQSDLMGKTRLIEYALSEYIRNGIFAFDCYLRNEGSKDALNTTKNFSEDRFLADPTNN
tara:strand:+ start:382 stop:1389 length:1008 start_codon:yes stop_codon:yes gene_type:complete